MGLRGARFCFQASLYYLDGSRKTVCCHSTGCASEGVRSGGGSFYSRGVEACLDGNQ